MPFAVIGFAAVVSMVPGVYVIRMLSGLVQIQKKAGSSSSELIGATLADGMTALLVVLAMAAELLLPMRVYDFFNERNKDGKFAK